MRTWRTIAGTAILRIPRFGKPGWCRCRGRLEPDYGPDLSGNSISGGSHRLRHGYLAMHDAIQAFEHRYEPYGLPIAGATGSPIAAAAPRAAAAIGGQLTNNNYLSSRGLLGNAGIAVGHQAASQIIALRVGTGDWLRESGGEHRCGLIPVNGVLRLRRLRRFSCLGWAVSFLYEQDSTQFRPSPPPPHLTSGEYVRDYNEVKALGRLSGSARIRRRRISLFYSDNFIVLWQRTLRGIGGTIDSLGDNARLFALSEVAAIDSVISSWETKKFHNFWRPQTAINLGESDGNSRTAGDPSWLPYVATPPYPDYTSGANNLTGSITRTLAHLLGDKTTSQSSAPRRTERSFTTDFRTWLMTSSMSAYQGIHFRFADEVGRRQGGTWPIGRSATSCDLSTELSYEPRGAPNAPLGVSSFRRLSVNLRTLPSVTWLERPSSHAAPRTPTMSAPVSQMSGKLSAVSFRRVRRSSQHDGLLQPKT